MENQPAWRLPRNQRCGCNVKPAIATIASIVVTKNQAGPIADGGLSEIQRVLGTGARGAILDIDLQIRIGIASNIHKIYWRCRSNAN